MHCVVKRYHTGSHRAWNFLLLLAISRWRHSLFGLSVCVSIFSWSYTERSLAQYLINHLWELHKICNYPALDNIRVMVIVWRVRGNIVRTALLLDCVTQCSQSAAHSCEQFLQVQQIGSFTLGPLCRALEAVAWSCIIVTWWSGAVGIQALSARPTGFLQFFDTWFGHMTYKNRPRYDL